MSDNRKNLGGARSGYFPSSEDRETEGYSIRKSAPDSRGDSRCKKGRSASSESFFGKCWNLLFSDESISFKFIPRSAPGVDRTLAILICILVCFGTVMVFSAGYAYAEAKWHDSFYYVKKQLFFVSIGLVFMYIASHVPVRTYKALTRPAFLLTIVLLLLVFSPIGVTANGARRWINLYFTTLQPSEIAKMTLVMMLAWYFTKYDEKATRPRTKKESFLYGTMYPLMFIGIICGLVLLEKHLSGIIILGCIGVIVMVLSGVSLGYLALFGSVGVAGVGCLAIFTDYTKKRIDIWLNPEAYPRTGGWQTIQGMLAIGSGGLFGLGLGNSRLKYSYVSEPQNDMIFTIACEELGLIGAIAILTLFALFVWRGYKLAMKCEDRFSQLVMLGIVTKVGLQVLLNVAVATNSIPNTGISLPFFSYGGSSLVVLLAEMGMMLSMSRYSQVRK